MTDFQGTAGNDKFTGTVDVDSFFLQDGGTDKASGGDGNDAFSLGASLDASDRLDGGSGFDTLSLAGDYSAGLVLDPATLKGFEQVRLAPGFDYNLSFRDGTFGPGGAVTIDAGALGAHDHAVIDDRAETDVASVEFDGGAGNDVFWGATSVANHFFLSSGGHDTVHGGDQYNSVYFGGGSFDRLDRYYGGAGQDEVTIVGDYSGGLKLNGTMMSNVETLVLAGGAYRFTPTNDLVAAGQTLRVDSNSATGSFNFNGAKETDGSFVLDLGGLAGHVTGGANGDTFLLTGAVQQTLTGGAGDDTFEFINATGPGAPTLITDYSPGDVVMVSDIDADSDTAGDQAFRMVSAFDGGYGEATLHYDKATHLTTLAMDINADQVADYAITFRGDVTSFFDVVL